MSPEQIEAIEREARAVIAQYSRAQQQSIEAGLYGPRDARLAMALFARSENNELIGLRKRIEELETELSKTEEVNLQDEEHLRQLIGRACDALEANCSGYSDLLDELRAEAEG